MRDLLQVSVCITIINYYLMIRALGYFASPIFCSSFPALPSRLSPQDSRGWQDVRFFLAHCLGYPSGVASGLGAHVTLYLPRGREATRA